jgi:transcriptional regulator with XRE-family HTH domain
MKNRLRKYRIELGLTQIELAIIAGITHSMVSKYEQGCGLRKKTARLISKALKQKPESVFPNFHSMKEFDRPIIIAEDESGPRNRVRELRKVYGISSIQCAVSAKIDTAQLYAIERGARCSKPVAKRISKALGEDLDAVFADFEIERWEKKKKA